MPMNHDSAKVCPTWPPSLTLTTEPKNTHSKPDHGVKPHASDLGIGRHFLQCVQGPGIKGEALAVDFLSTMVLTRSSSSPHTRAATARSPHTYPSAGLLPSPTSSLCCRRLALEAKHSLLYPITTTALGIRGVKSVKRRLVQRGLTSRLEVLSPRPPPSLLLPHNHQGHRLAGFILRTGAKNNDLSVAGAWVQPVSRHPLCPDLSDLPADSPLIVHWVRYLQRAQEAGFCSRAGAASPRPGRCST
jgi:hypothetical protein